MDLHSQKFTYDVDKRQLANRFTGNAVDVHDDKLVGGQNIVTAEPDNSIG